MDAWFEPKAASPREGLLPAADDAAQANDDQSRPLGPWVDAGFLILIFPGPTE